MLTSGRLIAAGESQVMLSFEWKSSTLDMEWPPRFVGGSREHSSYVPFAVQEILFTLDEKRHFMFPIESGLFRLVYRY